MGLGMVGCLLAVAATASAGAIVGCSRTTLHGPITNTNAGPCLITVTKSKGGVVKFSVLNVNGPELLVQRHGEQWGSLEFDVPDLFGRKSPLEPLDPNAFMPDPIDSDWDCLKRGDETSWYLDYKNIDVLAPGEKVRLRWKTEGPVPSALAKFGKPFPDPPIDVVLTVQTDAKN